MSTASAPRRVGKGWHELPVLVVVAVVLAVLVKTFLVQAFFIPSGSMEKTLHGCSGCHGDRVLVNKVLYKVRDIRRGEIVVFNGVDSFDSEVPDPPPANGIQRAVRSFTRLIGLGAPGEKDYIKRVIGLPGDRVACCSDGHVTVQPKGSKTAIELREPYLFEDDHQVFCAAGTDAQCPPGAPGVLVPEGRLWVMGDHRGASSDSRANGTIPIDRVIGRAFVVVWPLMRVKTLPVPSTFR
ncbi:MAG: signal peptidase [Actinomycetota bacterium]|nr:signal peptidase [Actinomycetota bacterium]